jgi:hypothetical protein
VTRKEGKVAVFIGNPLSCICDAFSRAHQIIAISRRPNAAPQWRGVPAFGAGFGRGVLTNVNKSMPCISGTRLAKGSSSQRFVRQRGRFHGNDVMR